MFDRVLTKSIRDQRRGIAGWSMAIVVLVSLMSALWPTVRDLPELDALLENYPEPFREVFSIADIGTARGYLNAELYSIILPAMFLVFGIGRGARLVAGDEEDGTLEPLLATPLSRQQIVVDKAAALGASILTLVGTLFVVSVIAGEVLSMDIAIATSASAALSMGVLGIVFGAASLAVGAATGHRSTAISAGATLAGVGYLLHVVGNLVGFLEPWLVLSPFHHLLGGGPLGKAIGLEHLVLLAVAVAAVGLAISRFNDRDIAVG